MGASMKARIVISNVLLAVSFVEKRKFGETPGPGRYLSIEMGWGARALGRVWKNTICRGREPMEELAALPVQTQAGPDASPTRQATYHLLPEYLWPDRTRS